MSNRINLKSLTLSLIWGSQLRLRLIFTKGQVPNSSTNHSRQVDLWALGQVSSQAERSGQFWTARSRIKHRIVWKRLRLLPTWRDQIVTSGISRIQLTSGRSLPESLPGMVPHKIARPARIHPQQKSSIVNRASQTLLTSKIGHG